jgi:hypothetical protein
MRVFYVFIIATTDPYIDPLAIDPFISGWDSNHSVPWMLHYLLWPPQPIHHLLKLKLTKPPGSLRGCITSANRFRIFYRSPMLSTSNAMINIGYHIIFRWETKCGYTCRKNALLGPIEIFALSVTDLTPSPRLWMRIILSSTFLLSLACTQCSTWIFFSYTSHHYWRPPR